jgi:hypothetical protein
LKVLKGFTQNIIFAFFASLREEPMRGDQLARQWRIIRAIETSPSGLTVSEIAKREETGIRTIYRDLEALQVAGFPLYNERVENANRCELFGVGPSKVVEI